MVYIKFQRLNYQRPNIHYLAILFGLTDEKRTARILETVLRNPEIPPLTTSFYKFFECDVLCRCGFIEEAFAEIPVS